MTQVEHSDDDFRDRSTTMLDRRHFKRLPPKFERVVVRTKDGKNLDAQVENVSKGGIGLLMASGNDFQVDDAVDVIYLYAAMPATVRHIKPDGEGAFLVGLQWVLPPQT